MQFGMSKSMIKETRLKDFFKAAEILNDFLKIIELLNYFT